MTNFAVQLTGLVLKNSILILAILLTFICGRVHGQMAGTVLIHEVQSGPGKINIIQDNEITRVIDAHLYEESKNKGIAGYRIRIYSNSGKQAYNDGPRTQAEFESRYEGIKTHYIFDSPFHRVYVGDFRTHSEAMKFLKEIEIYFPDAFIVRSKIDYPPL